LAYITATSERRDEKHREPSVEHFASDHAHGVRDRRDSASAERRGVDDAQQLVAQRDVTLERGARAQCPVCRDPAARLSNRMTARWLAETSVL
jgi:hypothetical protein